MSTLLTVPIHDVVKAARERARRCDTAQAAAVLDGIAERMEAAAAQGDEAAARTLADAITSAYARLWTQEVVS